LLGQGDMLYMSSGNNLPQRIHGAFVADEEVHKVVANWKDRGGEPQYIEGLLEGGVPEESDPGSAVGFGGLSQTLADAGMDGESDAMYDQAVAIVLQHRRASISLVQRHLRIGYNRAARLLEQMEKSGLVSTMVSRTHEPRMTMSRLPILDRAFRNSLLARGDPLARLRTLLHAAAWGLAALWAVAMPAAVAAADSIEQLQAFSRSTQSARGEFTQEVLKSSRQAATPAKGKFAFARPGRFRWEIDTPYRQLIVTDGKKLYFYDIDLQQVTVRQAADVISATPAAVLFGGTDLAAAFTLKDQGPQDGLDWVEATPKASDSGFDLIRVGMRAGLPAEMEVKDAFGQVNRFTFTRFSRNGPVVDSDFQFTPPAGVDVIQ